MVSLPHIFQTEAQNLPENGSSCGQRNSNISTYFCNSCTNDLALSVRKINPQLLGECEEKYAQIRNIQRLYQEDTETLRASNETFRISNFSKETLEIYALGFPLIRQSQLLPPQSDEFNWEQLKSKILKRQSRCQILYKTTQFRHEEKRTQTRNVQKRVRILPSLTHQKWESAECDDKEPPQLLGADPEDIVFDDLVVGGYYKRKCKITNVSCGKCRFQIIPFGGNSQFRVVTNKPINSLAPGLSFVLTIEFFCRSLADIEEELTIKSKNGKDLIVLVKVSSDPPYLIEANDNACNTEEVVDSLVDCGMHFVGEKSKTILTLKNVGNTARFCFISEQDWIGLEFNMDSSNTLVAENFIVQPMLFKLSKDQEITIFVTAVPPSSGLHTTRALLLCDNGSVNRVDFVCDGILFEPYLIEHVDMLKRFDVDIQDVVFAECYLDFGKVLDFDNKYLCFFLFNASGVNMHYHWELREVSLSGTQPLPLSALSISPMSGCLTSQLMEVFCMRADTSYTHPGVYKTLMVLVVDELPKKCVPLNYCDKLLPCNQEDEKELRSIEAKYIEVWIECVNPSFSLVPYVLDFSDFPLTCGSPVETKTITIKNESPGDLSLTWKCFEESSSVRLDIDPSYIQCDRYSTNVCRLSVEAIKEGYFNVSFWCISDKGDVKAELLVKGYCDKPRLTPLIGHIDFGLLKIGSQQNAGLVAKNCSSSHSFQWELNELHFRSPEEGLVIISNAENFLSTNSGQFCHIGSEVLVNFQFQCPEDKLWSSVLNWDGHLISVIADVQIPDVSLSTYTLSPESLFLGVQKRFLVTVSNHSLMSTAVFWGYPTNQDQGAMVVVEVEPICGVLEPGKHIEVEIRLTPHVIGPLLDLYIPCFVEGNYHPLLLKIEGNVAGLSVRVEWDSKDQHCCVVWPHQVHGKRSDKSLGVVACHCPPNSLPASDTSLDDNINTFTLKSDPNITAIVQEASQISEISDDFEAGVISEQIVNEEDDSISLASSIPYQNWPIIGGRYTRDPMSEEWESHFNNLFILEELREEVDNENYSDSSLYQNALCFHDIPVKKAITQTIYIRNDTEISSTYEASVVYNFERVQKPDEGPNPEEILKKIRTDENDEYVERASCRRGLTVFVTPASGQLMPDDYVILSVTVVARSWGHYSDMIVLQVGELDHLCIRLSVTVTQPPVIAPQQIRFGSLKIGNPPESHILEVKNLSTLPVYICWQVFTPTSDNFPFSAHIFDSDPFDFRLTDYYGSYSSPFFRTEEKYTPLGADSSATIQLKCYPDLINLVVRNNKSSHSVKAVLIGYIYLTDESKLVTNSENCIRLDGSQLPPVKVDLEFQVEVPLLSLLNVFNHQITFKCTAYDVISKEEKIWSSEKVIRVKNNSRTNLKAKLYTDGYFYVRNIEYTCAGEKKGIPKNVVFLRPGENCQVTIACEISEGTFLECFEENSEVEEEESPELGSLESGFLCFEQKQIRQYVKLGVWLYQPLLQFSESSLDFGTVYIEDTKMLIINITAPASEDSFEASIKSGENGPFSVNVHTGVLKPKIGFLLQVFFAPKCCNFYQDSLIIRTSLKTMFRAIPLTGTGTFDYKAHTY